MDFNYNENQKLISEMIRSFSSKEIVPNIKEWDDNQIFPVLDIFYSLVMKNKRISICQN